MKQKQKKKIGLPKDLRLKIHSFESLEEGDEYVIGKGSSNEGKIVKVQNKLNSDEECLRAIVEQYKKWYATPVTFTSHDGKEYTYTWADAANEIWALARMKRFVGDDISFSEGLGKFGIE